MAGASFSLSSAVLMSRLLFNQPPSVSAPLSLLSAGLSDQCHSSPLTGPRSPVDGILSHGGSLSILRISMCQEGLQ